MGVYSKKRGTWIADQFKPVGVSTTINSQSVRVTERDVNGLVSECNGTVTITDAGAGYAKGCRYTKTDGGVATTLFINEGSTSSCDFNAMETSASTITGVTAGKGLTGGGSEGSVTLNLGITIYNNVGSTLTPGTLVRLSGYTSTNGITVAKADADGLAPATHVVVDAITNNTAGVVYPVATVTGLATNGRTIGDPVYLDATTAGGFTFVEPTGADQIAQVVGYVKVVHASTGEIVFSLMDAPKVLGTSSLQESSVTTSEIADASVTSAKLTKNTVSNVQYSQVKTKTISGAALKALLNGATNNVMSFVSGDFVCEVILAVQTGGGVATIDVGTDAGFSAGAAADTLLVNVDANATGITRLTMLDAASQTATGAKGTAASGTANITITSSADISGGAFAGTMVIFYV